MEENTKRKPGRPRKPSTEKQAQPIAAVGVSGDDAMRIKAMLDGLKSAAAKPKAASAKGKDVKVDKATASRILDELRKKLDSARKSKAQEEPAPKFEVKGCIWKKDGESVRTIFIGDQVYAEFPMTEDGSVTAFYPYTPYDEEMGTSSVTFPADWLVTANAEQLVAMGCGATTITMSEEDDDIECCCDSGERYSSGECRGNCTMCDADDDDSISLDELADFAISEMDITMDDIEQVIKNMTE